jgi:hypothetical protein
VRASEACLVRKTGAVKPAQPALLFFPTLLSDVFPFLTMDPRASLSLFSRGATPPPKIIPSRSPEEAQPLPPPPQHRPETQEVSHHQPQPSPVHDIDALLRGLSSNTQPPPSTTQPSVQSSSQTQRSDTSSTTQTNPTESHTDKQNALLHNLMNPSGYSSQATQPQSDQMQRANPSPQGGLNDSQGKQLLEQLMAGYVCHTLG